MGMTKAESKYNTTGRRRHRHRRCRLSHPLSLSTTITSATVNSEQKIHHEHTNIKGMKDNNNRSSDYDDYYDDNENEYTCSLLLNGLLAFTLMRADGADRADNILISNDESYYHQLYHKHNRHHHHHDLHQ